PPPPPPGLAPTPAPIPTSQLDIAVALAHSGALLPVLHHLPRKDCNISLGYPLERSLLFRLLETVLEARNRRQPNGTTHWKTLADLVRHPYLRLLEANGISLRDIFQNMETRLRNGSRHADAHAVAEGAADDFFAASSLPNVAEAMPAIRELLNRILRDTVDTWARVHTLGGLADALSGLCDTLLVYGSGNDEDGAGNGKADIWNPHDAIWSQGNYMCNLASQVETAKKSGKLTGDTLELTLAAYNAGLGSVLRYGMVPPFEETINYVRRIKELAATKYTATGTAEGGTVGSLEPKLTVSGGIVSTAGITPDTRYPWGQCTWWAATRRADIGKPIPGWGNAATWAGSAASAGYTVDGSPSAGSVIVFQPGVLGASADYGHVAMVEEVRGDGSILISESNALGLGVVSTREISASQLAAAGNGVRYIH
ncbi:MAG: CHAP domain-containing protein, partial [Enterobacter cloacae]|nr:CHAP domain-containing protein [Enterobacter cloacae]